MKPSKLLFAALTLLLGLALVACTDAASGTLLIGGVGGDDDTAAGDDDTAAGDDDTATGDDDDDDDVSGEHELAGEYEGEFLMLVDLPGGGDALEESCEGWIWLEVEADGSYDAAADCDSIVWGTPDYEFELEGSVTTSFQFNGVVTGSNSWSGQVDETPSIGYIKDGFIKFEWEGTTPGQGQLARAYAGVGWMELD
jgi:hypothetical protein